MTTGCAAQAEEIPLDHVHGVTKRGSHFYHHHGVGIVPERTYSFVKRSASSRLRLWYGDNLRATGWEKSCRWEILVDGRSCQSGPIAGDFHRSVVGAFLLYCDTFADTIEQTDNPHRPRVIMGYCDTVPEGAHTLTVLASDSPGYNLSEWCALRWCISSS